MKKNYHHLLKTIQIFIFSLFSAVAVNASEDDLYDFSWLDTDKEVYVLQNRKFRKAGRLTAAVGYGFTTSGAFVDSNAIQGRVGFFFKEEWGFEGVYSKNSGDENDTALTVRNPGGAGSVPFRRIVESYYGGLLVWSPFYAKINTFNKIIYLDWTLGLGYGKVTEKNNKQEFQAGSTGSFGEQSETHNSLLWQTGLKFFLTEHFDVRLDFTALHYKAQKASRTSAPATEEWNNNFDLTLSLGMSL
jgi:outer membrane beta-barrel protein